MTGYMHQLMDRIGGRVRIVPAVRCIDRRVVMIAQHGAGPDQML